MALFTLVFDSFPLLIITGQFMSVLYHRSDADF
jgi:hypothetical protein